jgi:PAS domain S-box-containing protein
MVLRLLLIAGIVLILLLALTMYCLAQRITEPLQDLTRKLEGLESKRWLFARSIHTGNEIERLDAAAFDLTGRLRQSHDHLEELVRVRTKALMEQHAQDDAILRSIEYGLLVTDADGNVELLNDAACLLTGWSQEEAVGKRCEVVLGIEDASAAALPRDSHPITQVLASKQKFAPTQDPQFTLKRKDGSKMPLALRITPVLRGWHCSGAVAIFRDTTEDRRIDRMKSEFISLVSHQLRTPLSSMRWYLEMLLSKDVGPLNEDQQSYVEQVSASNERMVRLVNALLNVSRIELGTLSAATDTVNPVALAQDVVKAAQVDAAKRQIRIDLTANAGVPAAIHTDEVLLRLVIENLLANALKYGNQASTVSVTLTQAANALILQVRDTGIGIPPEEQHKVFSKLFRAKNAQSTNTDGNGLGSVRIS